MMPVLEWLDKSKHLDITAPPFIWWASAFLVGWACFEAIRFYWKVRQAAEPLLRASAGLRDLAADRPEAVGIGASARLYQDTSDVLARSGAGQVWAALAAVLLRRRSASGDDEYWLPGTAAESLSVPLSGFRTFNGGYFSAFPGLLTGCGLFLTFLAILFALMDVHAGPNQIVTGVGQLINGLSGKFLSSVVALLLAILFTLFERHRAHQLEIARSALLAALDAVFPRISAVSVLSELQQGAGDQIRSFFRDFGADLAERFRLGVSESMQPTLDRMVGAVEQLGVQMRAAEAARQELVTGSVERMMRDLSTSVAGALERMTGQFGAALTGGASAQFDRLQMTVTQTAEVLAGLGDQLRQMREGVEQEAAAAEDRRKKLEDAVIRMGEQMTQVSSSAAALAASSAERVVQRAEAWTGSTGEALAGIVRDQSELLESTRAASEVMTAASREFGTAISRLSGINTELARTVDGVGAYARSAADAAASARESHTALKAFSDNSAAWVAGARDAEEAQKRLWTDIQTSMAQYREMFSEVEGECEGLPKLLQEAASSQFEHARDAYEKLMQTFDNHFASAVQKLGAAVAELGETLDDLSDRAASAAGGRRG